MKINSPDYKLNLELVLKDKKSSGNVSKEADKFEKSKHGRVSNSESFSLGSSSIISEYIPLILVSCSPIFKFQINNFGTCATNATRPLDNRTCKPRPPGLMNGVNMTCQTTTGTVANWARNGATWTWNVILNVTLTMMDKVYSGVTFVADWCYGRMKWLA